MITVNSLISIILISLLLQCVMSLNKYSESANEPKKKPKTEFSPLDIKAMRELQKPFRMHKINLVWTKAKHKLSDPKLQSIFSDLRIQDTQEIEYKHRKADGKDESGLEEARLRKKLRDIMVAYGLLEQFESDVDPKLHKAFKYKDPNNYIAKDIFKDKKLNQLWAKAERAGFSDEELEALKEEFSHHQDKVEEYLSLLKEVKDGDKNTHENSLSEKPEEWNEIEKEEGQFGVPAKKNTEYLHKANELKERRLEIKSGYDHLDRIAAQGADHREFIEPQVQNLWQMALDSNFSYNELTSLKEELIHYQSRLLKLRHIHTEAALEAAKKGKLLDPVKSNEDHFVKKEIKATEKLHMDLEAKIMQKHIEL